MTDRQAGRVDEPENVDDSVEAALFAELHEIALNGGEAGLPVGGFQGASGFGRISTLPDFLDAAIGPFFHIQFDLLDGITKAAADGGIEILGINGMFQEGDFGHALQVVEVGDLAEGIVAEEGGIAEDGRSFGEEVLFQGLAKDGGSERAAARAAGIGGGIELFDEGFVHARRTGDVVNEQTIRNGFEGDRAGGSEFEEGLGFDDREVFRERMKGVDQEAAGSFLDFHEADGNRGPAGRGRELVSHERPVTILKQFLMEVMKDFRLQLFVLEAEVILEAGFETD